MEARGREEGWLFQFRDGGSGEIVILPWGGGVVPAVIYFYERGTTKRTILAVLSMLR